MNRQISKDKTNILLIDGHCYLCQGITKFVIKRDSKGMFQFAALQSKAGRNLLSQGELSLHALDTFVLIQNGNYYTKSGAALRVMKNLRGLWRLMYLFIIVPPWIRNIVYDWIAANRYRWFGNADACLLPTPDIKSRFLAEGIASDEEVVQLDEMRSQ